MTVIEVAARPTARVRAPLPAGRTTWADHVATPSWAVWSASGVWSQVVGGIVEVGRRALTVRVPVVPGLEWDELEARASTWTLWEVPGSWDDLLSAE